jgi:hypothetical protein
MNPTTLAVHHGHGGLAAGDQPLPDVVAYVIVRVGQRRAGDQLLARAEVDVGHRGRVVEGGWPQLHPHRLPHIAHHTKGTRRCRTRRW